MAQRTVAPTFHDAKEAARCVLQRLPPSTAAHLSEAGDEAVAAWFVAHREELLAALEPARADEGHWSDPASGGGISLGDSGRPAKDHDVLDVCGDAATPRPDVSTAPPADVMCFDDPGDAAAQPAPPQYGEQSPPGGDCDVLFFGDDDGDDSFGDDGPLYDSDDSDDDPDLGAGRGPFGGLAAVSESEQRVAILRRAADAYFDWFDAVDGSARGGVNDSDARPQDHASRHFTVADLESALDAAVMGELLRAASDHPAEELGGMPGVSQALAPVLAGIAVPLASDTNRSAKDAGDALRRLGRLYDESPGAKCECFVALCQVVVGFASTTGADAAEAPIAQLAARLWLAACIDVPSEVLLLLSPARGRHVARMATECSTSPWVCEADSDGAWREAWHTCALGRFALAGPDGAFKPAGATSAVSAPTDQEAIPDEARAVISASFVAGVGIRTPLGDIAAAVTKAAAPVGDAGQPTRRMSSCGGGRPLPPSPPAHGSSAPARATPPPTHRSSVTPQEVSGADTAGDVDAEALAVAAVAVAGASRHGPAAVHEAAKQVAWRRALQTKGSFC